VSDTDFGCFAESFSNYAHMPRSPRILFEGAIYHVTFRGNNRQDIFVDVRDRRKLMEKLEEAADTHQVRIYLFCLMSNHVHLLIETPNANLNRFMASLLTSYTLYFNIKNQRSGHLFQGRYGAQVVAGDQYLLRLSRYIHLNPVRTEFWKDKSLAEKIEFLDRYVWSSYRFYAGMASSPAWLERAPLLALTAPNAINPESIYLKYVQDGLAESDDDMRQLVQSRNPAIGSVAFLASLNARKKNSDSGKASRLRKTSTWIPENKVKETVLSVINIPEQDLQKRRLAGFNRAILSMALQKFSGLNQRQIGEIINLKSNGGVSALIKRWKNDSRTLETLKSIENGLI